MKQYISKKQWDELNDEQKEYFMKECNCSPTVTIGQMIEFLGDWWKEDLNIGVGGETVLPDNNDLCDALWEACVNKLKQS